MIIIFGALGYLIAGGTGVAVGLILGMLLFGGE